MRPGTIYALCDPNGGDIRYVGMTVVGVRARVDRHLYDARSGRHTHLSCWLRSLDQKPLVIELDAAPNEAALAHLERRWIAELRKGGARLCNHTDGGEGVRRPMPTETRRRLSDTRKRMGLRPARATIEAAARANRGRHLSASHRAKLSAAVSHPRGPRSAATREKIRRALRGRNRDPVAVAKGAAAHRGMKHKPRKVLQ